MVHGASILSLNFSRDLKLLASGDQAGTIKVWKTSQGKCLRTIESIQGINNILLSYTNARVLASTLGNQIKVFGLKSGSMLKEMPPVHDTFIHSLQYLSRDADDLVLSASCDGRLCVWSQS